MKKVFVLLSLITSCCYGQVIITPAEYTPRKEDPTILQRSLENLERRSVQANEEYSKLLTALGEIGEKLNNDTETLIWFRDYKKNIEKKFSSLNKIGDYGLARDYAIRKRGEVLNDPEIVGRIKTAQEYASLKKSIDERLDLTTEEKKAWYEDNPYCFVPIIVDNEIIGGRLGTKEELEKQIKGRLEKEQQAQLLEEQYKEKLFKMAHAFDDFDYSKYDKVVYSPHYKKGLENLEITSVALSKNETRVEFKFISNSYSQKFEVTDMVYITKGKEIFNLVKAENISLSPQNNVFQKPGEILTFALIFPSLPPKTKSFSLENPIEGGWIFKDINLDYTLEILESTENY